MFGMICAHCSLMVWILDVHEGGVLWSSLKVENLNVSKGQLNDPQKAETSLLQGFS